MDSYNSVLPRYQQKQNQYSTFEYIQNHASHLLNQNKSLSQQQQLQVYQPVLDDQIQIEKKLQKKLFSPTVQLTGHGAEVFCVKFSPNGEYLASAGSDKLIFLWDIYNNCNNYAVLKGHTNAILELHWSTDGDRLYTASADKSLCVWDVEAQKSLKKLKGHASFVNSCHPARRGPDLVASGSDDGTSKIWDTRQKNVAVDYDCKAPVTAVSFNDTTEKLFIGGLDNQIKVLDLRKKDLEYTLFGHTDTITAVSLSHDGSYLLSNSMDQTIRCFDVRPFVVKNRCVKIFQGAKHSHEKNLLRVAWSNDGELITAGSADRIQYIWDTTSKKVIHRLSGPNGSVNECAFSPTDKLCASASSDKTVIIGEIPQFSY